MRIFAQKTAYPIFAHIFEAREQDLVDRLPMLYPNAPDRMIAQAVLIPLWRSCVVAGLESFMARTGFPPLGPPIAETVASLCADVDKAIKANRFLCDLDGRGKPIYDYIVACRKSVGSAIEKELKIERERAKTNKTHKKTKRGHPTVGTIADR